MEFTKNIKTILTSFLLLTLISVMSFKNIVAINNIETIQKRINELEIIKIDDTNKNNAIEIIHELENIIVKNFTKRNKITLTEFNKLSLQIYNFEEITNEEKEEVIESHTNILNNIKPILIKALHLKKFQRNSFKLGNIDFDLIMELNACARNLYAPTQSTSEIAKIVDLLINRLLSLTIENGKGYIISKLEKLNISLTINEDGDVELQQNNILQRKKQKKIDTLKQKYITILKLEEKLSKEIF